MTRPPRNKRIITALNALEEIFTDKSQDATIRVLAAGLLAQILDCPIDLSVGAPMGWKDSFIRLRKKVRRAEAEDKQQRRKDRKQKELNKQIDDLLSDQSGLEPAKFY